MAGRPKPFSCGEGGRSLNPSVCWGLKCGSPRPVVLVFRGHLLVFNSYSTISMLCFYVAPPSGISGIKAILVCPGYFHMALGALLSPPCASLAPALFTLSSFLLPPPLPAPSTHESAVGRSLLSRLHSLFIPKI